MHIGFTGTRKGLSKVQRQILDRELLSIMHLCPKGWYFHHGDCIGADAQAHEIAHECSAKIILHPPLNNKARAFCEPYMNMLPAKHYLVRNCDIVNVSNKIIACPEGPEILRSGTWSTIRYAKKQNKRLTIITSDGNIVQHG